jgi:bifunctional ADP-heptose synthase (sugar kinase/adenylyltransferase)
LKGAGRPVTNEHERAELVSAIRGVTYVTIFHDQSPARLIAVLKPDVHCKGTDYTADTVPEREVVLAYGGRIAIVGDAKEHSTSEILRRMKAEG